MRTGPEEADGASAPELPAPLLPAVAATAPPAPLSLPEPEPEHGPADAATPEPGPKKRAPRRRKTAPAAETTVTDTTDDTAAGVSAAADTIAEAIPSTFDTGRDAPEPSSSRSEEERRQEAVDLAVGTVEALLAERGADDKIWGSMVKQTLKRRRPGFAESYYGYRSFNELLEDARDRGLLALEHDEKSGGYVIRLL
jgi:hypothetical protein